MSGIHLQNSSKLAINRKNDNGVTICVTICQHEVIFKFFWCCFVSLVKFNYWSKFHVSIIDSFGVMKIFLYKGLTRNPEIGNTPVWVFSIIWRLGWVRNTKFGTNVSNKMLLNAAKWQGCIFYSFWVINGKPTGAVIKLPPHRLGLNEGIHGKASSGMLRLHSDFIIIPLWYQKFQIN